MFGKLTLSTSDKKEPAFKENCKLFLEYSYLIMGRLFADISNIKHELKDDQNPQITLFKTFVEDKYQQIRKEFNNASMELTAKEEQFVDIISRPFAWLFNNGNYKESIKFLEGNEVVDYLRKDQIKFIGEKYAPRVAPLLKRLNPQGS